MSSLPKALFEPGQGFARDARFVLSQPAAPQRENADDPVTRAFTEGYARGAEDTEARMRAEAAEEMAARGMIEAAFERLAEADSLRLEERLRETILVLCEQAVAPLAIDPQGLSDRIRKALTMLRRAEDERILRLNPQDQAMLSGQLPADLKIEADATLERGEIRVETPEGGVEDGPQQWRRILAEALGSC
jgi:flagellar assembly protein FliH